MPLLESMLLILLTTPVEIGPSEGKEKWADGSPCCTPESGQIKIPLAMRGVCEPYAKDASLKISGQFIKQLRRIISRRMELNAF